MLEASGTSGISLCTLLCCYCTAVKVEVNVVAEATWLKPGFHFSPFFHQHRELPSTESRECLR